MTNTNFRGPLGKLRQSHSGMRLIAFLIGVLTSGASNADAPLIQYWVWVDMAVQSCSAATLEAPQNSGTMYVPNDRHRTAVVTGRVVGAGYAVPANDNRTEADRATRSPLPPKNSKMSMVLAEWDEGICKRLGANADAAVSEPVRRFRFNYGCDTWPRLGRCLPPLQLVDIDEESP